MGGLDDGSKQIDRKNPIGLERFFDIFKNEFKTLNEDVETVNALNEKLLKQAENFYKELNVSNTSIEKPSLDAFSKAYFGYEQKKQSLKNKKYLTIIDYSPKSTGNYSPSFYIINMETKTVEYQNTVGYGRGSRLNDGNPDSAPLWYSNENGSNATSLGFFSTDEEIVFSTSENRQGLRLHGLEDGINSNAYSRAIYIHPAGIEQSDGCFTLPYDRTDPENAKKGILNQISKLQGGSMIFAYDSRVFHGYSLESNIFLGKHAANGEFKTIKDERPHQTDNLNGRITGRLLDGREKNKIEKKKSAQIKMYFYDSYVNWRNSLSNKDLIRGLDNYYNQFISWYDNGTVEERSEKIDKKAEDFFKNLLLLGIKNTKSIFNKDCVLIGKWNSDFINRYTRKKNSNWQGDILYENNRDKAA